MRKRSSRRRDGLDAPPSSRRPQRVGYRFATTAALVRHERMRPTDAKRLVDEWASYVRHGMTIGKDPADTAAQLARFSRSSRPPPRSRDVSRNTRRRSGAGSVRISDRGIPFRVCGRGTEIESLIFPPHVSERAARKWATDHGFVARKIDISPTTGSLRMRQREPSDFERGSFRTIQLSDTAQIRAVIGCPRAGHESDRSRRR